MHGRGALRKQLPRILLGRFKALVCGGALLLPALQSDNPHLVYFWIGTGCKYGWALSFAEQLPCILLLLLQVCLVLELCFALGCVGSVPTRTGSMRV